jgi:hypothetical protein
LAFLWIIIVLFAAEMKLETDNDWAATTSAESSLSTVLMTSPALLKTDNDSSISCLSTGTGGGDGKAQNGGTVTDSLSSGSSMTAKDFAAILRQSLDKLAPRDSGDSSLQSDQVKSLLVNLVKKQLGPARGDSAVRTAVVEALISEFLVSNQCDSEGELLMPDRVSDNVLEILAGAILKEAAAAGAAAASTSRKVFFLLTSRVLFSVRKP